MGEKHYRVSPEMTRRARELRKDMTWPEKLFWSRIKGKQLLGARFRKQHPIGSYIVDFYGPSLSLVIEIDGMSHIDVKADAVRQQWLEDRGMVVVRYTNDEIIEDVDSVIEDLERRIELMVKNHPPLTPP